MNDYEVQRLKNISRNRSLLQELKVASNALNDNASDHRDKPPRKKRKFTHVTVAAPATRKSSRLKKSPAVKSYNESEPEFAPEKSPQRERGAQARHRHPTSSKPAIKTPTALHSTSLPTSIAELHTLWRSWKPTGKPAHRDANSVFHFSSHPDFTPNKSPEEILREGCFGGSYFRPLRSSRLNVTIEDDWRELPAAWTAGLDARRFIVSPEYNPDVNKFKVACGQSIEEWEAAGWIAHEFDVRGWFQWYCRFFQGRRCADDDRQVGRWKRCVGETGRWRRALLRNYVALGVREVFDDGEIEDRPEVSPVMHQTCHHWAFEVRQEVLDNFWRLNR